MTEHALTRQLFNKVRFVVKMSDKDLYVILVLICAPSVVHAMRTFSYETILMASHGIDRLKGQNDALATARVGLWVASCYLPLLV